MTKRQMLITQLRTALGDLQSPAYFDYNETVTFTIDELDFEYTEENMDEEVPE